MSMNNTMVIADPTRCVRCGTCEKVCPNQVFTWSDDTLEVRFGGRCIHCGHCVAVCPNDAFSHRDIKREFKPVDAEPAVTSDALQSLFEQRRSCRVFNKKPITDDELAALMDAAARAPTATNSQSVRFILLDDPTRISRLAKQTASYYLRLVKRMGNPLIRFLLRVTVGKRLVDNYRYHLPAVSDRFRDVLAGESALFYNAPLVIIALSFGLPQIASANVNLAVMQMMLKAETIGLGTVYNGYALTALQRDKTIRAAVGIPPGYTPCAVMAVGHPAVTFRKSPPRRSPRVIRFYY
jgi:nitroreductase/NAD-dependent dihydropyrimidine dehydrogenase PreA subunit